MSSLEPIYLLPHQDKVRGLDSRGLFISEDLG